MTVITIFKVALGLSCIAGAYHTTINDKEAPTGQNLLKTTIEEVKKDHIVLPMLACRIIEITCLFLAYRWARNIKIDIIRFIRLLKKDKPGQKLDSMFEEDVSKFNEADYKDFDKFDTATAQAVI